MTHLEGKVAFVTGASRGIGAAVARALSSEGVRLGLASRSGDDLGLPDALGLACDVRDLDQVEARSRRTVERFGRLDICVANAGVGSYHTLVGHAGRAHRGDDRRQPEGDDLRDARFDPAPDRERRKATSSRVASEAGRRGLPGEAVYCASKFGQVGLTRALDHELREHGVRCTNVCPGGVATDFALADGYGRPPRRAGRDDVRRRRR